MKQKIHLAAVALMPVVASACAPQPATQADRPAPTAKATATGGPALALALDDLRWRNRVLVVFAPAAGDPRAARQRAHWSGEEVGFAERDLVIIESHPGDPWPDAARLRREHSVAPDAFRVLLVGKDGGVKLAAADPVEVPRLYALIDSMPMRQAEAARQARPGG